MQLPATIGDGGELPDLCGDGLVADDETDVHCVCEVRAEVDADGDWDAPLALCGGVAQDMDDACGRDDGRGVGGSHAPQIQSPSTTFKRIQTTHVRKGLFRPIIPCPLLIVVRSPFFLVSTRTAAVSVRRHCIRR